MVNKGNYKKLFAVLSDNLDAFIREVEGKKLTLMATSEWTVKDVLCHIVFWHENYAANYDALSKNKKPPLLGGPGYKLNKDGVDSLRRYPLRELIRRLRKAQSSLKRSIVEKKVPRMTYKKDGRVYTTPKFLNLIARHLLTHARQVRRAK